MALSFNLALLRLVGIWPGSALQRGALVLLLTNIHFAFVGMLAHVFTQTSNILEVAEGLYIFSVNVLVTAKIYNLLSKMKIIQTLVYAIEASYKSDNSILKESARKARRISIGFFCLCFFTGTGFAIFPMTDYLTSGEVALESNGTTVTHKKLPFMIWVPHLYESPVYEVVYLSLSIHATSMGYFLPTFDTFMVALILLTCGQFKLLQSALRDLMEEGGHQPQGDQAPGSSRLEQVPPNSTAKLESSREELPLNSEILTHNYKNLKNALQHQNILIPNTAFEICLQDFVRGPGALSSDSRSPTAHGRLMQVIKHHQALLGLADQLNALFSNVMLLQFICSLLLICLTGFQTLLAPPDGLEFVFKLSYLASIVSELFLLCWTGEQLLQESVLVADAAYNCDWPSASVPFKHCVRLIILRAQKPVTLRAGKFTVLAIDTFTGVMRVSYSYFTVLREFLDS